MEIVEHEINIFEASVRVRESKIGRILRASWLRLRMDRAILVFYRACLSDTISGVVHFHGQ